MLRLLLRLLRGHPAPKGEETVFIPVASLDKESRRYAVERAEYARIADADRVVLVAPSGYGWVVKEREGHERSVSKREVARMKAGYEPTGVRVKWSHHPTNRLSATGFKAGRFGGGWQWCLGIKVARRNLIVELLIGSLRVTW